MNNKEIIITKKFIRWFNKDQHYLNKKANYSKY